MSADRLIVVGLSHHTAPIEVRERAALSHELVDALLTKLHSEQDLAEAFIVSTCNRVELIGVAKGDPGEAASRCARVMAGETGVSLDYFYRHSGRLGMRHLLRVASSLDSLVVGEPQILGQMKQGFERARELGLVGKDLLRTFDRAVQTSRRVRNETQVGQGQVSVPSIAIELATQIFGDLRGHKAALLGTGEMGQTVLRLLKEAGAEVTLVGRRLEKAEELAQVLGARARPIEQLAEVIAESDIVVSSTSATEPVITLAMVQGGLRSRRGRSLFLIDLAVPRDVQSNVGELEGVYLYNVDDLSGIANQSAESRRREAERAEQLVEAALLDYERWADGEQVTPLVKALHAKYEKLLSAELERSLKGKLKALGPEEREALVRLLEAARGRLLHDTTRRLRELAQSEGGLEPARIELVRSLFGISDEGMQALDDETQEGAAPYVRAKSS